MHSDCSRNIKHARAAWLDQGIVMTGEWETLRGMNRIKGGSEDARLHAACFSEDTVVRLKAIGINLFIAPLYRGFGVNAERAEMEQTRRFARLCRRHGIRVGVYVQSIGTIFYETFFKEVPQARNWVSRDADGRIPVYGAQTFRYAPCLNCDAYLRYIERRVLTYAVRAVNADMVHFDNFLWWAEPKACRCERCIRKFRLYLGRRWPNQRERFSHFGLDDFSFVMPPVMDPAVPGGNPVLGTDAISMAWLDFKCDCLARVYERFTRFLRALKPGIVVECNVSIVPGSNSAVNHGAWPPRIFPHGDIFWSEEGNIPGPTPDGRLVHRIRSFKMGQATRNFVFMYNYSPLALAEAMAFNQNCLGMVVPMPKFIEKRDQAAPIQPLLDFYRRRQDLFRRTESAAEVAVLHSYLSLVYHPGRPHLELILAEQCLIQHQIPYDILYDDDLERLPRYKTVVLPDSGRLSDRQLAALTHYVDTGGGLVMTGCPGGLGEYGHRVRNERPLDVLAGMDMVKAGNASEVQFHKNLYGNGRVGYVSRLKPPIIPSGDKPISFTRSSKWYDNRWWRLPLKHQAFAALVKWAAGGLTCAIEAPETVAAEVRAQPEHGRLLLHLVNYGGTPASAVRCCFNVPRTTALRRLRIFGWDKMLGESLPTTAGKNGLTVTVRRLPLYAIVEIPVIRT